MHNRPDGFDVYYLNIKTIRMIAQIFVAFSEKLNFMIKKLNHNIYQIFVLIFVNTKGGLISESLSLWLKSHKKGAKNHYHEHLLGFLGDLSQSEKLSEIKQTSTR